MELYLWDKDVTSKYAFRSGVPKSGSGVKLQALCHWNPHTSFKELLWPFKPQKAMLGRKGRDFTCPSGV